MWPNIGKSPCTYPYLTVLVCQKLLFCLLNQTHPPMNIAADNITTSDGLKLKCYYKKSAKDSKRAVFILHGYAEYTGRYARFIVRLSNEGYHVFALDHAGHGNSEGEKAMVRNFGVLSKHAAEWMHACIDSHPDFQWFLFGHSMGGGVAIDLVLTNPTLTFSGLVLTGPLIQLPPSVPEFLKPVGHWLGRTFPSLPLVPLELQYLSRDADVVRRYKNDPLVYSRRVKAATAAQLDIFTSALPERLSNITVPFWVGHGGADQVTDPKGSKMLKSRAQSSDKTLKIYEGFYHELLNEPESEAVMHDIIHWMNKH
jgi:acylglycerol lipase